MTEVQTPTAGGMPATAKKSKDATYDADATTPHKIVSLNFSDTVHGLTACYKKLAAVVRANPSTRGLIVAGAALRGTAEDKMHFKYQQSKEMGGGIIDVTTGEVCTRLLNQFGV